MSRGKPESHAHGDQQLCDVLQRPGSGKGDFITGLTSQLENTSPST